MAQYMSLRYIQDACNIEACEFEISSIKHRDTGPDHVANKTPRHRLRSCCLARFGTPLLLGITQKRLNHQRKARRVIQLMYLLPVKYDSD